MTRSSLLLACAFAAVVAVIGCGRGTRTDAELTGRLEEADQVFRSREYDEAGRLYEAIAEDAEAAGDVSTYVEACAMRARSLLIRGHPEEVRPWLERAAQRADADQPLGWSRYLGVRGRFEWDAGDNETATRTFREMFDFCERHELWDRAVDAAHMVALTGDPEEKLEWATKGIAMAEHGNMTGWLGPLWNNLGWDYVDAERYEEAREALIKAREYHYMSESELPKLIADYSVAHVTRLLGELDQAEQDMSAVFDWAERLHAEGNPDAIEWMGFSRWELGEIALARADKEAGLALMEEALGELEAAGMPRWDEAGWNERRARVAELQG
jgi:tetratricopeptide (TPR) repeat protein